MTSLLSPAARNHVNRTTAAPATRSIRWIDPAGRSVFAIAERRGGTRTPAYVIEDVYTITPIESPLGAAYHLEKCGVRGGPDHAYDVLLAADGCRCDCKGFEHHGHCRHVSGLVALLGQSAIPAAAPAAV
jgi:hypothetical protein